MIFPTYCQPSHPKQLYWPDPQLCPWHLSRAITPGRNHSEIVAFGFTALWSSQTETPSSSVAGPNTLLCRLRVGRSFLKSHGFAINLSQTDKCICGDFDIILSFFLSCFLFKTEDKFFLAKINSIYPQFSKLSKSKQCDVLFFGINLNNSLPNPRNRSITFAVQDYITKTNRFSKHYEWI